MLPPLLNTLRPPFLLLAAVTVLLSAALAARLPQPFPFDAALLVLIGALAAHGAVNSLNEYADFRSGLDLHTEPTPFSGGSGYLPAHPHMAFAALLLGLGLLALCLAIGLLLIWRSGPALLWIGLPGVLPGGELVLTGSLSVGGVLAGVALCCLTNNLLLLNQLPDRVADKRVGRDNIPLRYGLGATLRVYALQWLVALLALGVALAGGWLPPMAVLVLPTFAFGAHALIQSRRPEQLMVALRSNVLQTLLVPALLALCLVIG